MPSPGVNEVACDELPHGHRHLNPKCAPAVLSAGKATKIPEESQRDD